MQPFHFPRTNRIPAREITVRGAIEALAAAEVGAWVTDAGDERAWTSHGRIAIQRAQVRLFNAFLSGKVTALVRVSPEPGLREIDADFWRVGNPAAVSPLPFVFTAEVNEPELRLAEWVAGQGVPEEVAQQGERGASIFVSEDEVSALMPAGHCTKPIAEGEAGQRPQQKAVTVSNIELEAWAASMIAKGCTGRELKKMRLEAFPGKEAPSQERVAKAYRNKHWDDLNEYPKVGVLHPMIIERRQRYGIG